MGGVGVGAVDVNSLHHLAVAVGGTVSGARGGRRRISAPPACSLRCRSLTSLLSAAPLSRASRCRFRIVVAPHDIHSVRMCGSTYYLPTLGPPNPGCQGFSPRPSKLPSTPLSLLSSATSALLLGSAQALDITSPTFHLPNNVTRRSLVLSIMPSDHDQSPQTRPPVTTQ